MSVEQYDIVMPSSPEDRRRVMAALNEMVNCMTRIAAEQDCKKEIATNISEEYDIPKKLVNKAASILFKQNFQSVQAEHENLETFLETLKMVSTYESTEDAHDTD